jgi:hypothetical protein
MNELPEALNFAGRPMHSAHIMSSVSTFKEFVFLQYFKGDIPMKIKFQLEMKSNLVERVRSKLNAGRLLFHCNMEYNLFDCELPS